MALEILPDARDALEVIGKTILSVMPHRISSKERRDTTVGMCRVRFVGLRRDTAFEVWGRYGVVLRGSVRANRASDAIRWGSLFERGEWELDFGVCKVKYCLICNSQHSYPEYVIYLVRQIVYPWDPVRAKRLFEMLKSALGANSEFLDDVVNRQPASDIPLLLAVVLLSPSVLVLLAIVLWANGARPFDVRWCLTEANNRGGDAAELIDMILGAGQANARFQRFIAVAPDDSQVELVRSLVEDIELDRELLGLTYHQPSGCMLADSIAGSLQRRGLTLVAGDGQV